MEHDFNSFIRTYEHVIHQALATYIGKSSADYDDVKQEALLKAWNGYSKFSEGIISSKGTLVTPEQFLYNVTKDECYRFYSIKNKKRDIKISYGYEITDYSNYFASAEDCLEIQNRNCKNIHSAVNSLPDANQKYIKYFITGHTHRDISDRDGTCFSSLSRLKKDTIQLLRKSLLGDQYQPPVDKVPELLRQMKLHDALERYNSEKLRTTVVNASNRSRIGTFKRAFQLTAFELGIDAKKVSDLTEAEISQLTELTLNKIASEHQARQHYVYIRTFLIYVSLRKRQSRYGKLTTEKDQTSQSTGAKVFHLNNYTQTYAHAK